MKKSIPLSFLLFLPALYVAAQYQQADFANLHALEGVWKMDKKTSTTYEVWKVESDTVLSAISYRVAGKDTTMLESVNVNSRHVDPLFLSVDPPRLRAIIVRAF